MVRADLFYNKFYCLRPNYWLIRLLMLSN
jgi:hypothetical protein